GGTGGWAGRRERCPPAGPARGAAARRTAARRTATSRTAEIRSAGRRAAACAAAVDWQCRAATGKTPRRRGWWRARASGRADLQQLLLLLSAPVLSVRLRQLRARRLLLQPVRVVPRLLLRPVLSRTVVRVLQRLQLWDRITAPRGEAARGRGLRGRVLRWPR